MLLTVQVRRRNRPPLTPRTFGTGPDMKAPPCPAILLAGLLAWACGSTPSRIPTSQPSPVHRVFTSDAIGWTLEIPEGWEVLGQTELKGYDLEGRRDIAAATGRPLVGVTMQLIGLKRSKCDAFNATYQVLTRAQRDAFAQMKADSLPAILATYASRGIPSESTEDTELIDGIRFDRWLVTLMTRDRQQVTVRQIWYNALVGDAWVFFTLTYRDDSAREQMLGALRRSRFAGHGKADGEGVPNPRR